MMHVNGQENKEGRFGKRQRTRRRRRFFGRMRSRAFFYFPTQNKKYNVAYGFKGAAQPIGYFTVSSRNGYSAILKSKEQFAINNNLSSHEANATFAYMDFVLF